MQRQRFQGLRSRKPVMKTKNDTDAVHKNNHLKENSKTSKFLDSMNSRRTNELVFIVTTFVSLSIYIPTLAPSIVGGDAGELVAEGCKLGTSHPPGYPLFTVLVYIVTNMGRWFNNMINMNHFASSIFHSGLLLPKSPAYFVNFMSTCFGAMASGLISSSAYMLLSLKDDGNNSSVQDKSQELQQLQQNVKTDANGNLNRIITVTAAVFVGIFHTLSPLSWYYSVTAEVFALHNLFVAATIHTSIRFATNSSRTNLLFGSFLCGLSLTNQHTSILLQVPIILWVLSVTFKQNKTVLPMLLLQASLYFLTGLSVYALLPYFSITRPHAGSWGNVTTLSGLLDHMRRKDYGTFQLYSGDDTLSESLIQRVYLWVYDFAWSQGWCSCVSFVCLLLGFKNAGSGKQSNGIIIVLNCSLVFYLLVFHSLSNLPLSNALFFGIHQVNLFHSEYRTFKNFGVDLHVFFTFNEQYLLVFRDSGCIRISFVSYFLVLVLETYSFGQYAM